MIIDNILKAKALLIEQGVKPKYIKVSPSMNQALVAEINKRNNGKAVAVFEYCGLTVQVDNECPMDGAYLLGEEGGE